MSENPAPQTADEQEATADEQGQAQTPPAAEQPAPEVNPSEPATEQAPAADADPSVVKEESEPAAEQAPAADADDSKVAEAPAEPAPEAAPPADTAQPKAPAPAAPKPSQVKAHATPVEPTELHTLTSAATDPTKWGHVADDGTVVVHAPDGERAVGSYPTGTPEEALAYFGRKFDELVAQVDVAEQRLGNPDAPVKDILRNIGAVKSALPEANVVGDIAGLVTRITQIEEQAQERRAEIEKARQAARAESAAKRTALVEEAEKIAATDENRMQWKQSTERMKSLLDEWKAAQAAGPRLDKASEDALWKRFSHARNGFDRMRRHHFAKLHTEHEAVKAAKEKLITRAEELSSSTDWAATSAAYRSLMDDWKKAGRASRKEDDALWARFRAAQDVFFQARNAKNAEVDAEFGENLKLKEALLVEAEALLPIKDIAATKTKLRSIHQRWDEIGKVPRNAMNSVERRMRAVEQAVRDAEGDKWKRNNPETKARAEGALGQLDRAIAGLEEDLAAAQAKGDKRRIKEAQEALDARKAWREQIAKLG